MTDRRSARMFMVDGAGEPGDLGPSCKSRKGANMPSDTIVRLRAGSDTIDVPVSLDAAGPGASAAFNRSRASGGVHLLVGGDRDYAFTVLSPVTPAIAAALSSARGRSVIVRFAGRGSVRPRLKDYVLPSAPVAAASPAPAADTLDLTEGRAGAAPLWLLPSGLVSARADAA